MADISSQANLSAFNNLQQPANPLQMIGGYADLANKFQQNANMKQQLANEQLANETGQQALGQKMSLRHAQIIFGLTSLPNAQLPAAASKALDDELASGQIDQQRYGVMKQQLDAAQGNPSALRQAMMSGLIGSLAGPDALKAMTPDVRLVNTGGAISPVAIPSAVGLQQGQALPGAMGTSLSPQLADTGGELKPVGGVYGGAPLTKTLTPAQHVGIQDRLVQNPDGTYSVVQGQAGQLNPSLAPKGALGPGGYVSGPPMVGRPMGTEEQLQSDQKAYQADKQAVPELTTGTQSLGKALGALNAVATGAGTEGLAKMRAYATSLGNVLGVDTGGVNVQDMNRAELEKYLTSYASQSAKAGRSDEALNTAFKANASGAINNAAAQDVVRTNIGRDRQTIAATLAAPNPQGAGYTGHKADFANTTDPRGFAWDTYTKEQRDQIIKEVGGKGSAGYKKLSRSVGYAQNLGLLNMQAPQPTNVNAAPGNALSGQ